MEALQDAARRRERYNDTLASPAPLTGCHASTLAAVHRGRTVPTMQHHDSSTRPRWQIGHANRLTGAPRHTVPHPPPPRPTAANMAPRAHHAARPPCRTESEQNRTKSNQNRTKKRPKKDQKKTKKRENYAKKTRKITPKTRKMNPENAILQKNFIHENHILASLRPFFHFNKWYKWQFVSV